MKNNNVFKYEINESIQAHAAMNCLRNRNTPKKEQMNEVAPLVLGAVRLAMPLLRPLITKIVKSLVLKAGAKLTGRQVAKAVIKNVANGKTLLKVGKKVGQTWTKIPTELKQEIAKTAVDTYKQMRQPQEQEESATPPNPYTKEYLGGIDVDADVPDLFDSEQERHDMALACTYALGESWIDNDGDLDDIYYAVLRVFDETYDAPISDEWKEVKTWCQKYYRYVEEIISEGEEEQEETVDEDNLRIKVSDLYEYLMEYGGIEALYEFPKEQIKNVIRMKLKETPEDKWPDDGQQMVWWVEREREDIVETLARATGRY